MRLPLRPRALLSTFLWLIPAILALHLVASRIYAFAHIFGQHAGITITQDEIAAVYHHHSGNSTTAAASSRREQVVPKIIHQIFHNWRNPGHDAEADIPEDWARARKSCVDLHPGWEVKLWSEKASRDFIATEYPTFLSTYDGYRFPVQRTDALRYFLMLHYGGIYMDLDNGCLSNLEPLLYYPTLVADGAMGALSNNILIARPNHPFWLLLTHSLRRYDRNYVLPYVVISYASGQWFETAVWEEYHALLPDEAQSHSSSDGASAGNGMVLHRLVLDGREADRWVFFTAGRGGSWNQWDHAMFGWIGGHIALVVVGALAGLGVVGWYGVRGAERLRRRARRGREGGAAYSSVGADDSERGDWDKWSR